MHLNGRNPAVRRGIYRALLHLDRVVGESVLLPLRISVPRFLHSRNLMLADINSHGLLPIVWRRLQVVVAQFYSERRIGRLCTGVFSLLLRDEAGNHRASADPYVFRLHRTDGSHILATHRYDRFFCRICVHQEDIRGRQDRLVKIIVVRVTLDGVNLVLFLF